MWSRPIPWDVRGSTARTASVLLATLAVCVLLAALGWFLQEPGYTTSRLAFFAVIGGAGVLSLYGIVVARSTVAGVGVVLLFLLGFWQAVLWIVVYPVVALLVVAMAIDETDHVENALDTD